MCCHHVDQDIGQTNYSITLNKYPTTKTKIYKYTNKYLELLNHEKYTLKGMY